MNRRLSRRMISQMICAVLLLTGTNAIAFTYLAADISQATVKGASLQGFEPHGLRIRAGVRLSRYFDVELALGGNTEAEGDVFDKLSANYAGIYVKGYVPVRRNFGIYLLAGSSKVEVSQTINTSTFSDSNSGPTFGFGIESQLTPEFNISADYILYSQESGGFPELSVFAIGVKWNM